MPATIRPRRASAPSLLARPSNTKLGKAIYSFSVPAVATCPGRTDRCSRDCYATRGFFRMPNVAAAHAANLRAARRPDFARRMTRAIDDAMARVVRVHVAGDFFAPAYVASWIEVARKSPGCLFYAYTRSWRVPWLLAPLLDLADLPNVQLWFSTDGETGPAPIAPGVRTAHLVTDAFDEAMTPAGTDLVFRERRHELVRQGQVKRIAGARVCPVEQGAGMQERVTCSSCRICWRPPRDARGVADLALTSIAVAG
jgi:hypothetical protein